MKVADLSVNEFRKLVAAIVEEKLAENLGKPAISPVSPPAKSHRGTASQVTLAQVCREFGITFKE